MNQSIENQLSLKRIFNLIELYKYYGTIKGKQLAVTDEILEEFLETEEAKKV